MQKKKKTSICGILYIEKLFKEERSSLVKNNKMFEYYVSEYADMLYKLAFAYLKSYDDSNDVVQNVLLNFYKTNKDFESEEHIKYWLVRCTINECKKFWRTSWHRLVSFEEIRQSTSEEESDIEDD